MVQPSAHRREQSVDVPETARCTSVNSGRVRRSLAQVRDLLGRVNPHDRALQAAVERLEGCKTFYPKTEVADKVSRIFQEPTEESFAEREDAAKESLQVIDSLRDGEVVPVRRSATSGSGSAIFAVTFSGRIWLTV